MSEELLPCPFCGSEGFVEGSKHFENAIASCCNSKCSMAVECCGFESLEEATKAWNTRHLPPEVEAVLEAAARYTNEVYTEGPNMITKLGYLARTILEYDKGRK